MLSTCIPYALSMKKGMTDFSWLQKTAVLTLLTLILPSTLLLRTTSAQVGEKKIPIQPSQKTVEVVERDGNIYSLDKSGREIRLTSSGIDLEPSLSADKKWVTFLRENPNIIIHSSAADCPDSFRSECLSPAREIWVMASDGSHSPRLVVSRKHFERGILDYFMEPTFSNDSSEVYFLAPQWVTSHALYAVDMQDSSIRVVTAANSLEVVRNGKWAGHIIAQKHKYFLGSGSYDWYWLISSDGKDVGPIGTSTTSFKQMWCQPTKSVGFDRLY